MWLARPQTGANRSFRHACRFHREMRFSHVIQPRRTLTSAHPSNITVIAGSVLQGENDPRVPKGRRNKLSNC
jgi:hypothetical protein